jgi:hypothetical protein
VVPDERGEAGHVLVTDVEAVRPQLVHGGVHVTGVEQHERVEDQAQGADLVLHTVLVTLVELSGPAVEDLPGERVPAPAWPAEGRGDRTGRVSSR